MLFYSLITSTHAEKCEMWTSCAVVLCCVWLAREVEKVQGSKRARFGCIYIKLKVACLENGILGVVFAQIDS